MANFLEIAGIYGPITVHHEGGVSEGQVSNFENDLGRLELQNGDEVENPRKMIPDECPGYFGRFEFSEVGDNPFSAREYGRDDVDDKVRQLEEEGFFNMPDVFEWEPGDHEVHIVDGHSKRWAAEYSDQFDHVWCYVADIGIKDAVNFFVEDHYPEDPFGDQTDSYSPSELAISLSKIDGAVKGGELSAEELNERVGRNKEHVEELYGIEFSALSGV